MSFQGREAVSVENEHLRLTVLREGGHIAEILHKKADINPLWIPPWPSAEPSTYDPDIHHQYGPNPEARLLMGIMGHNLCLDTFGPPSIEEAEAGLTTHGESSIVRYEIERGSEHLKMSAQLPLAGLSFQRSLALDGESVVFNESVYNRAALIARSLGRSTSLLVRHSSTPKHNSLFLRPDPVPLKQRLSTMA